MRPYASLYIVVHAAGGGIGTRHLGECECTAQGTNPPKTQSASTRSGPGTRSAIVAGERKMPEPMVDPTRPATALQSPTGRGKA